MIETRKKEEDKRFTCKIHNKQFGHLGFCLSHIRNSKDGRGCLIDGTNLTEREANSVLETIEIVDKIHKETIENHPREEDETYRTITPESFESVLHILYPSLPQPDLKVIFRLAKSTEWRRK